MLTNQNYVVKEKKFEVPENPETKIDHIRQNLYDAHEKLYKRYSRMAKPVEEATNARLASVSIVEWVIFLCTKRKERRLGKIWQLYKPKLRVNRLRVIRICKVCESMRFDSGPEVFVRVNRNYVLTEYVLNENDCNWNEYHVPQILPWNPFDGERNLVNAKNTPVVLVMAIAAFDLGSSVASPVNLHKCTDWRKDYS